MGSVRLVDRQAQIRARKRALGILLTPEQNEALRNPGHNRTPEKRELLARIEARRASLRKRG